MFQWCFHSVSKVFQGNFKKTILIFQLCQNTLLVVAVQVVLALPWPYHDLALTSSWSWFDLALNLLWPSLDITLALPSPWFYLALMLPWPCFDPEVEKYFFFLRVGYQRQISSANFSQGFNLTYSINTKENCILFNA